MNADDCGRPFPRGAGQSCSPVALLGVFLAMTPGPPSCQYPGGTTEGSGRARLGPGRADWLKEALELGQARAKRPAAGWLADTGSPLRFPHRDACMPVRPHTDSRRKDADSSAAARRRCAQPRPGVADARSCCVPGASDARCECQAGQRSDDPHSPRSRGGEDADLVRSPVAQGSEWIEGSGLACTGASRACFVPQHAPRISLVRLLLAN